MGMGDQLLDLYKIATTVVVVKTHVCTPHPPPPPPAQSGVCVCLSLPVSRRRHARHPEAWRMNPFTQHLTGGREEGGGIRGGSTVVWLVRCWGI